MPRSTYHRSDSWNSSRSPVVSSRCKRGMSWQKRMQTNKRVGQIAVHECGRAEKGEGGSLWSRRGVSPSVAGWGASCHAHHTPAHRHRQIGCLVMPSCHSPHMHTHAHAQSCEPYERPHRQRRGQAPPSRAGACGAGRQTAATRCPTTSTQSSSRHLPPTPPPVLPARSLPAPTHTKPPARQC